MYLGIAIGILLGAVGVSLLMNHSGCCASLGSAALGKYGLGSIGGAGDSVVGGAVSALGLA